MTGLQSIIALVIAIVAVVFIGKVILRLVSRPVVKNYVTVPPPAPYPVYPHPSYYPNFSPGIQRAVPPRHAEDGPVSNAGFEDFDDTGLADRSDPAPGDDPAFDALVREFYRR